MRLSATLHKNLRQHTETEICWPNYGIRNEEGLVQRLPVVNIRHTPKWMQDIYPLLLTDLFYFSAQYVSSLIALPTRCVQVLKIDLRIFNKNFNFNFIKFVEKNLSLCVPQKTLEVPFGVQVQLVKVISNWSVFKWQRGRPCESELKITQLKAVSIHD